MPTNVRRIVIQLLATSGDTRFHRGYFLREVRAATGCTGAEAMEALWGLVADGLVYLDPVGQSSPDNWRWSLSADGRHAAQGGSWEPRDPDGYLNRLRHAMPDMDSLIEMYITEALLSFNARCYLATSVMLGVAAERAFLIMSRRYAESTLRGAVQMAIELNKPRSNYFMLWTEFRKRIEPLRNELPEGTADPLTLDAVAELIRLTRNEVGHPTGRRVDEDTARVHLTIAPSYFQKLNALTSHFTEHRVAEMGS